MKKVAIAGATGIVGSILANHLSTDDIELDLYASEKSANEKISVNNRAFTLRSLDAIQQEEYDYIFTAVSADNVNDMVGKIPYPATILDLSSANRQKADVPLLLYGVNHNSYDEQKLIGLPNCVVAPVARPIQIVGSENKITNIFLSTYQSITGAGRDQTTKLIEDLQNDIESMVKMEKIYEFKDSNPDEVNAFNAVPKIDDMEEDGSTGEESKIKFELRKILNLRDVEIIATCVRVPVIRGHCASVNIVCDNEIDLNIIKEKFLEDKDIVFDENIIPSPRQRGFSDKISIGRLRVFKSSPNIISFWVVGDNLDIGAAGNAYKIYKYING